MTKTVVYVGTYGEPITTGSGQVFCGGGQGLYCLELDPGSGRLSGERCIPAPNVSFLVLSDRRILYAVNELDRFEGRDGGALSAFSIRGDGLPVLLGRVPSGGRAPCHLCTDRESRRLFAANYLSGSISVHRLLPDGAIGEQLQRIQHAGSGADPVRQEAAHVHWVLQDSRGSALYAADLGTDQLITYSAEEGLSPVHYTQTAVYSAQPGDGPRSLVQSGDGNSLYLTNELSSLVTVLKKDAGQLTAVQHISALPSGFAGANLTSEPHLSGDGNFLYVGNRGHDSICRYRVDPLTGRLSQPQWADTHGRTPRSFAIDPSGRWLLAANQDSDSVTVFRRHAVSGELTFAGAYPLPTPVCIRACLL